MKNVFFIILILSAMFSVAGNGRIEGKVKDSQLNEPLQYASVALYTNPDSKLVAGGITNEEGQYEFKNLDAGNQPTKWWNLYIGANIYNQKYEGDIFVFGQKISVDPKNDWVYSINANTSFNLTKSMVLQGNLNYLSARPTAQGEDSRFLSPYLSLKKSFFKNKMSASVQ